MKHSIKKKKNTKCFWFTGQQKKELVIFPKFDIDLMLIIGITEL